MCAIMVKFLLLVMSLVNTSLLDNRMVEMQPLQWKEYEEKAYPTTLRQFIFPLEKIEKPFNKPDPLPAYYPMSEYTIQWRREKQACKDAFFLVTPQYYMTPFITREHTQDLDKK